jgi:hypothetical protein
VFFGDSASANTGLAGLDL